MSNAHRTDVKEWLITAEQAAILEQATKSAIQEAADAKAKAASAVLLEVNLQAACNYIDKLGGVSTSYRQTLARVQDKS